MEWSGESILETHKIEFDGIGGSQLENDVYKARLMRFNLGPDAVGIHGKQDLFVRLDASEDKWPLLCPSSSLLFCLVGQPTMSPWHCGVHTCQDCGPASMGPCLAWLSQNHHTTNPEEE